MPETSVNTPDERTDAELVILSNEGNQAATDILIRRTKGIAEQLATVLTQNNAAVEKDDLIQYGLLGILSAIKTYRADGGASFRTYATTCVRNSMLTALRKARNRNDMIHFSELPENFEEKCVLTQSVEDDYFSSARVSLIKGIIKDRLTDIEREVLEDIIEGLSYKQIAEKRGRGVKAVDGALQRARKKISAALAGN